MAFRDDSEPDDYSAHDLEADQGQTTRAAKIEEKFKIGRPEELAQALEDFVKVCIEKYGDDPAEPDADDLDAQDRGTPDNSDDGKLMLALVGRHSKR
jgi:hypothetical protein